MQRTYTPTVIWCAIARASIFARFDLLNRNTSKVTQEIPVPSGCWACHFLPRGKKVTGPTYWGSKYFFRNFWCVEIQEVKPGENESPCNGASTDFCFRTLPTNWRGAINRTSSFSLKKKIPETQRFNNHKILKKTAQNSICMRTATSYGHNTAKKNRGSSMTFPEIYSFFPFLEKTSIWTSMSLI